MSLSDLAAIGSFVSGLAVLISLIFLYFQLRQVSFQVQQAEKNQRALMNQGYITRTIDLLKYHAGSHLNDLRSEIVAGKTDFNEAEITELSISLRCSLLNVQDAYVQHKSGLMDQITFDNSLGAMKAFMAQPVYRALWTISRTSFAPEMVEFVDKLIAGLPIAKPMNLSAELKNALSDIMRR